MAKVLVVDDDPTMVQIMAEVLRGEGHEVLPFTRARAAMDALEAAAPDLVITDLYLEGTQPQGLEVIEKARALDPPAQVILITGHPSMQIGFQAKSLGAYEVLEKPIRDLDVFKLRVRNALSYQDLVSENADLRRANSDLSNLVRKKYHFSQLIGSSPGMQTVFRMIERVADTESTILLRGESGTGKELVARALHFNSRRRHRGFVPINCSALPENLLESELFGHRRGAFTGAVADKKGLFQEADGGTLFLDEIGTMPPVLQSRLLRVLQEGEVRRVGDNVPSLVDVRVIAATNEALEKRVKEGAFREDLYYRLNVIPIPLPPLRERKEDIPLLVQHFLRERIHARTREPFRITRQAMETLGAHDWPGNVRELENAIERACALAETAVVRLEDLPPLLQPLAPAETSDTLFRWRDDSTPGGWSLTPEPAPDRAGPDGTASPAAGAPGSGLTLPPLKVFLRDQELAHLNRALAWAEGDKEKAAEFLGISLATLYRKLGTEAAPDK